MDKCVAKLTVCFEEPFWIGLYERECGGQYEVCKITFGAEPRDCEVYAFFLKHWSQLQFSPSIQSAAVCERRINPKRMQRSIENQMRQGIGTKAQQALKLQQEQRKQKQKASVREKRELEAEQRFALHQEKRRAKHRGH